MYKNIILNNEETCYLIHDDGRLFNKKTNHFLKGSISNGYKRFQITWKGKKYNLLCHRLVALYFINNEFNYDIVHHKDGNKLNNHINNLQWVDSATNLQEAYNIGARDNKNTVAIYITDEERKNFIWKQIDDTQYYISEYGGVFNNNTGRKLKPKKDGYLRITYYKNNKTITESIHRLVFRVFYNINIDNLYIDHIDGNKFNNHYSNLRVVSASENMINAQINGHKSQKKIVQLNDNYQELQIFPSIASAARYINCQPGLISRAIKLKTKSHGYFWKIK